MSDTNINAYEAEVQEAEKAVGAAQANLDQAKQRLNEKKAELGIPVETEDELPEVEPLPEPGDVVEPTQTTEPDPTNSNDLGDSHES